MLRSFLTPQAAPPARVPLALHPLPSFRPPTPKLRTAAPAPCQRHRASALPSAATPESQRIGRVISVATPNSRAPEIRPRWKPRFCAPPGASWSSAVLVGRSSLLRDRLTRHPPAREGSMVPSEINLPTPRSQSAGAAASNRGSQNPSAGRSGDRAIGAPRKPARTRARAVP